MKKHFKKFWYAFPMLIAVVALIIAGASFIGAVPGDTVVSNVLDGNVVVAADAILLKWSPTGAEGTYTTGPLTLNMAAGADVQSIWVKSTSQVDYDIDGVVYVAACSVLEGMALQENDGGWVALPPRATGEYTWGGSASGISVVGKSEMVKELGVLPGETSGNCALQLYAVIPPAP